MPVNSSVLDTATRPPLGNVRHELDASLVRAQIEKAIAKLEDDRSTYKAIANTTLASYQAAVTQGHAARWSHLPGGPGYVDPMIDANIVKQRDHYGKVRVIECPVEGNRFRLVYGEADDATVTDGTGPFETFELAAKWFLTGGR